MKRVFSILGIVLLIAALTGGGYWLWRTRLSGAVATAATGGGTYTQIVTVQRGDLTSSITVVGELVSELSADLVFEHLSGSTPLLTLNVQQGSTVTAGQVLATVDPAPYQQALDQARSDLQAVEKKLADLGTPVSQLDIARADLAVARARLQREEALNALDQLRNPDMVKLQTAVADAQRTLAQAQADLLALQNDTATAEQLAKLRDAEAAAAAEHGRLASETYTDAYHQDRLQIAFNKMMNAVDARVTAEVQAQINLLKAQMQVRKAEAALADARAALVKAQGGGDALQLAKAELAVKEAELAVANAEEARAALDAGPDAVALAAAQAEVERKRLAVVEAEAALAGTELRVPFGGTVLRVYVAAGDLVTANTRVVTVADLSRLQVLAAVDETVIRRVAAGQGAVVTFDALPGQVLRGAVVSVPLQGTLQGGVTVYEVPVALEGAAGLPLLVGMTANVAIQTGEVKDALLVPTLALQRSGGRYQVRVPNTLDPGGMPEVVPVEVGLSDGVYTQVVRGLNEGDQVIVELSSSTSTTNPFRGFGAMMGGGQPGGGPPPNVP